MALEPTSHEQPQPGQARRERLLDTDGPRREDSDRMKCYSSQRGLRPVSVLGVLAAAALAGAGAAQGVAPDRPGTLAPPNPLLSDRPAALAAPAPAPAARPAAPAKRPAARKPAARKKRKGPPINAAYTRGLYTVGKQGDAVYYRRGFVLGVGVNVIEADLSHPGVRVGAMVSRGGIGTAERFSEMVRHAQPTAAITGTFFGIRNRIPTGDLVINGKAVFRGFIGTAVAITEGNVVSFIPTRYKDQGIDWSLYDTVIRGGPRLVWQGRVEMTAYSDGFRSLPIKARRTRTAVGLTRDNRLQFVAVREGITLWELAKVMRAIGAYHAVALDGGTSTAMYFAGRYIANPGRGLTNVLMIYHRREQFEAMRDRFGAPYEPRLEVAPPVPTASRAAAPEPEIQGHGFEAARQFDYPLRGAEMAGKEPAAASP